MTTRNRGAVLLARTGKSQTEVAAAIGVSVTSAHRWITAEKKPGGDARAKLAAIFGIPEPSWDEPDTGRRSTAKLAAAPSPTSAPGPASAAPAAPAAWAGGPLEMARELEAMARQQLRDLRDDAGSLPLERAKVMNSLAGTLNLLAKLDGHYDLGRRMLKLPMWKRIEQELSKALAGHPDAARAVAERFAALDAELQG